MPPRGKLCDKSSARDAGAQLNAIASIRMLQRCADGMLSLGRRRTLRPRKKGVGFAPQPIGDEADPLLRGPVELDQR
jgi:hypothetical protein